MGAIIWGIMGAFWTLIGLVPFLGIVNLFLSIPCLVIGLLCGIIGICKKPVEKRGASVAGTVICGLFLIIAGGRTIYGWVLMKSAVNAAGIENLEQAADKVNKLNDVMDKLEKFKGEMEQSKEEIKQAWEEATTL